MNDGQLIELVTSFCFLYDKRESKFRNKIARENAWTTIGEIVEESPTACEQRWIVLRAKYTKLRRQLKTIPSGAAAVRESWPHFDAMGFLDPHLTTRNTSTNYKKSSQQMGPEKPVKSKAEAWNTLRYILNADDNLLVQDESQSQTEDSSDTNLNEDSQDGSSTESLPSCSRPAPVSAMTSNQPACSSFHPVNAQTNTPKSIPRKTLPLFKKRTAQEAMCDKMGDCFESLSKKMSNPAPTQNESEDLNFAKSMVADMKILRPDEKILFKRKLYDFLGEIIDKRSD